MQDRRRRDRRWGAWLVVRHARRVGQIVPLWAESGKWGPQRHPAAPGKPWSVRRRRRVSGCRISSLCFFRQTLAAAAPACMPPACTPACICLQLPAFSSTFLDTSLRAFLLHSLGLVAGASAFQCGLPITASSAFRFIRPIPSQHSNRERRALAPATHLQRIRNEHLW